MLRFLVADRLLNVQLRFFVFKFQPARVDKLYGGGAQMLLGEQKRLKHTAPLRLATKFFKNGNAWRRHQFKLIT